MHAADSTYAARPGEMRVSRQGREGMRGERGACAPRTPTGFRPPARGCGVPAATPGHRAPHTATTPTGLCPAWAGGGGDVLGHGMLPASPMTQPLQGWTAWVVWTPGVAPRTSGQPRAAGRNRVAVGPGILRFLMPHAVVWASPFKIHHSTLGRRAAPAAPPCWPPRTPGGRGCGPRQRCRCPAGPCRR